MKRLAGILTFSVLVFGLLMHLYNSQTHAIPSTCSEQGKRECINSKLYICRCNIEQPDGSTLCMWQKTDKSCGSPTKKPEPTKTTPKPTKTTPIPTPIPTQQPKPPKKPKPSKTTSRPNYCQSATISTNTLEPGQSLTITSTANNNKITKFTYAFYNLDNLNGPNDPKSIMFSKDKIYTVVKSVSPTNKQTITVNYADLDKPDLNWGGKKPTKIQVNAYFSTGSDFSLPAVPCVVKFNLRPRSTRIAITPTPANTPTPTPTTRPPTPSCSKKTSGDANCDGLINGADLTIWKCQAAGQTNCGQPNLAADFDLSGSVDLNDFEIWRQNNYQE